MNLINKIINLNIRLFSQTPKDNNQIFVALALLVYFLAIFTSSFFMPYYIFWNKLGVPAELPIFGDLQVITSGFECHRLGYDVIKSNPCFEERFYHTAVNYPRIWMSLAPWGLAQDDTRLIGILIVFLFFCCIFLIIPPINQIEGWVYSLILCSPSIMLAVERANNDLIIFILLTIVIFLGLKPQIIWHQVAYLILLFAAILKLYPIFGFPIVWQENRKNVLIISSLIFTLFIIYVLFTWPDIELISIATPRYNKWSYGYKIIFNVLSIDVNTIVRFIPDDQPLLKIVDLHDKISLKNFIEKFLISLFFILQIILFSSILKGTKKNINVNWQADDLTIQSIYISSFRLGAGIYIGTFLLGNNWAYRLIFLIFTIPQIFHWIKNIGQLTMLSNFALVSIIVTLWMKTTVSQGLGIYFHQFFDWFLFFYLSYALLITLPDRFKSLFNLWKMPLNFINLLKTKFTTK